MRCQYRTVVPPVTAASAHGFGAPGALGDTVDCRLDALRGARSHQCRLQARGLGWRQRQCGEGVSARGDGSRHAGAEVGQGLVVPFMPALRQPVVGVEVKGQPAPAALACGEIAQCRPCAGVGVEDGVYPAVQPNGGGDIMGQMGQRVAAHGITEQGTGRFSFLPLGNQQVRQEVHCPEGGSPSCGGASWGRDMPAVTTKRMPSSSFMSTGFRYCLGISAM